MSTGFNNQNNELIVKAIRENLSQIADLFNQCFETNIALKAADNQPYVAEASVEPLNVAGLAITFEVADQGLMCFVPSRLLPEWTQSSSEEQTGQLEAFAMKWAEQILPTEISVAQTAVSVAASLHDELQAARPHDEAQLIRLGVSSEQANAAESSEESAETPADATPSTEESDGQAGEIFVVWPVRNPPVPITYDESDEPIDEDFFEGGKSPADLLQERLERLRNLPISVSVRLAEKKIALEQLMSITPGGLITFDKPCEDLLELFVNNQLMFRGEAVKIGENFGLKVNEVGAVRAREEKIVNF